MFDAPCKFRCLLLMRHVDLKSNAGAFGRWLAASEKWGTSTSKFKLSLSSPLEQQTTRSTSEIIESLQLSSSGIPHGFATMSPPSVMPPGSDGPSRKATRSILAALKLPTAWLLPSEDSWFSGHASATRTACMIPPWTIGKSNRAQRLRPGCPSKRHRPCPKTKEAEPPARGTTN